MDQIGRLWNPGMMASVRSDWATPRTLFEMLDKEFHFTLDVCAAQDTATCAEWFGSGALERPWVPLEGGAVWCNPPYGREIGKWVEKGYRESLSCGSTVVMLLPARSDTQWFHAYCLRGEIRFLRGRLNFDDLRPSRAPFPSMIVVFRPPESGQQAAQIAYSRRSEAAHAILAAGFDPEPENDEPRRSDQWCVAQGWRDALVEEAYAGTEA